MDIVTMESIVVRGRIYEATGGSQLIDYCRKRLRPDTSVTQDLFQGLPENPIVAFFYCGRFTMAGAAVGTAQTH